MPKEKETSGRLATANSIRQEQLHLVQWLREQGAELQSDNSPTWPSQRVRYPRIDHERRRKMQQDCDNYGGYEWPFPGAL